MIEKPYVQFQRKELQGNSSTTILQYFQKYYVKKVKCVDAGKHHKEEKGVQDVKTWFI